MRHFLIAAIAGTMLMLTGLTSTSEAQRGWNRGPGYRYGYRVPYGRYYAPRYYGYRHRPYYGYGYYRPHYGYYWPYDGGFVRGPGFSVWW